MLAYMILIGWGLAYIGVTYDLDRARDEAGPAYVCPLCGDDVFLDEPHRCHK